MVINVPGEAFFFNFRFFFLSKISLFFLPKEKGVFFCGRLSGHNFGHPLDRKQTIFLGWPYFYTQERQHEVFAVVPYNVVLYSTLSVLQVQKTLLPIPILPAILCILEYVTE